MKKYLFSSFVLIAAFLFSCNSGYELDFRTLPQFQKVSLEGEFCTKEGTAKTKPVKILFIVDTSGSMNTNDPDELRKSGVLDAIDKYYPYEHISFAVSRFSTSAYLLTDGFIRDADELTEDALEDLDIHNGWTDTKEALELARDTILKDIESIKDEYEKERTSYIILILSDGLPNWNKNLDWDEMTPFIDEAVDNIMDIRNSHTIDSIVLNTALLSQTGNLGQIPSQYTDAPDNFDTSSAYDAAVELMTDMANDGGGFYTHFEEADDIDFEKIISTTINVPYVIEEIIISNQNSKIVENVFKTMPDDIIITSDTDGDGLSDLEEEVHKASPISIDTDGDGISDFTEVLKGMSPLTKDYDCPHDVKLDRDGDKVLDCEEILLGTNYFMYDTDGDLLPDGIEIYNGLNPADASDVDSDTDSDEIGNYEEIKKHTNPILNDNELHEIHEYKYNWEKTQTREDGYSCYNITIENIGITQTMLLDNENYPYNIIDVHILQTATIEGKTIKLLSKGSIKIEFDEPKDIAGHSYSIEDIDFYNY